MVQAAEFWRSWEFDLPNKSLHKEKRITVINLTSDKAMGKDTGSMWGEERMETIDVA